MYQALVFLTVLASAAMAAVPLYGQCGGSGWTGETTCTIGICSNQNEWYSQCVLGQTTNPPASTVSSTSTAASPVGTTLPSSFTWSSTGVLISPQVDSRNLSAWKDPSVVFHDGKYHVFASTAHDAGYNLVYLSFTDFDEAESAPFYYLDETPIGSGYRAAPQVFFMAPQNKWYLIFQNGNAAYSTNSDISNPNGWTPPQNFYAGTPNTITNNIGSGFWVDMWVICDSSNCHLFSSDDNGHLYRSQTSISNFPAGMSEPVIALQDSNSHNLFEASNVYKVGEEFLLIVECIGSDGHRYFRSWSGTTLIGSWTPLAASQTNPFAGTANVAFSGTPWTMDISHGEVVRTNVDQTMSISACGMRYLYQGMSPTASGSYNSLPWRLALLTQTSPC